MSSKMRMGGVVTGHPWGMVDESSYEMKCVSQMMIILFTAVYQVRGRVAPSPRGAS